MSQKDTNVTKYTRTPYLVVSKEVSARKDVYGSVGDFVVRHAQLMRGAEDSDTVIIGMHPVGSPAYLPAFSHLARRGHHVIGCGTRYVTGDAGLQMENVLLDLAACVRDARERLGYKNVVLAGWSGGGSVMATYQAEATQRTIVQTAAGEETALATTELIPADGLLMMAAHRSRHALITDFLDASITNELTPEHDRASSLDLYGETGPQVPYSPDFVITYRAAQLARNRRITAWAQERLQHLKDSGRPDDELGFIVHGTMADPRWLDPAVDPNDRRPGWSYLGDPRTANNGPAGLARFCTLRGWLSQWGYDTAQVDAVRAAPRIEVPTLVVINTADNACPAAHLHDFVDALPGSDKVLHELVGASHYFSGGAEQLTHLDRAADFVADWRQEHQL